MLYYILYYIILNYIVLCYAMLYYTTLYSTILYYTLLYYTIPYYTLLYCTILYYTILYYTILLYRTILYFTILYYTVLYYTIYHVLQYMYSLGPPLWLISFGTWSNAGRRSHFGDRGLLDMASWVPLRMSSYMPIGTTGASTYIDPPTHAYVDICTNTCTDI